MARLDNLSLGSEHIVIDALRRDDPSFKAQYDCPYVEELREKNMLKVNFFGKVVDPSLLETHTFREFVFKAMKRKYH